MGSQNEASGFRYCECLHFRISIATTFSRSIVRAIGATVLVKKESRIDFHALTLGFDRRKAHLIPKLFERVEPGHADSAFTQEESRSQAS